MCQSEEVNGAYEITQHIKAPAAKAEDLREVSGTYMVAGEN